VYRQLNYPQIQGSDTQLTNGVAMSLELGTSIFKKPLKE